MALEAPYSLDGYPRDQEKLSPPGTSLGWIEVSLLAAAADRASKRLLQLRRSPC